MPNYRKKKNNKNNKNKSRNKNNNQNNNSNAKNNVEISNSESKEEVAPAPLEIISSANDVLTEISTVNCVTSTLATETIANEVNDSLENDDMTTPQGPTILEISDSSSSIEITECNPIVSEVESELEENAECEPPKTDQSRRIQNRLELESHFLPQLQNPRYLESIIEENSDSSDVERKSNSAAKPQTPQSPQTPHMKHANVAFPKGNAELSKRRKHLRAETVPLVVEAKILHETPVEENCSHWETDNTPEIESAEMIYINSASSSASDLTDSSSVHSSTELESDVRIETPIIDLNAKFLAMASKNQHNLDDIFYNASFSDSESDKLNKRYSMGDQREEYTNTDAMKIASNECNKNTNEDNNTDRSLCYEPPLQSEHAILNEKNVEALSSQSDLGAEERNLKLKDPREDQDSHSFVYHSNTSEENCSSSGFSSGVSAEAQETTEIANENIFITENPLDRDVQFTEFSGVPEYLHTAEFPQMEFSKRAITKLIDISRDKSFESTYSEDSQSTTHSQCTAINVSLHGRSIKQLKVLCIEKLMSMPYGNLVIENLALTSENLGCQSGEEKELGTNQPPPIPPLPQLNNEPTNPPPPTPQKINRLLDILRENKKNTAAVSSNGKIGEPEVHSQPTPAPTPSSEVVQIGELLPSFFSKFESSILKNSSANNSRSLESETTRNSKMMSYEVKSSDSGGVEPKAFINDKKFPSGGDFHNDQIFKDFDNLSMLLKQESESKNRDSFKAPKFPTGQTPPRVLEEHIIPVIRESNTGSFKNYKQTSEQQTNSNGNSFQVEKDSSSFKTNFSSSASESSRISPDSKVHRIPIKLDTAYENAASHFSKSSQNPTQVFSESHSEQSTIKRFPTLDNKKNSFFGLREEIENSKEHKEFMTEYYRSQNRGSFIQSSKNTLGEACSPAEKSAETNNVSKEFTIPISRSSFHESSKNTMEEFNSPIETLKQSTDKSKEHTIPIEIDQSLKNNMEECREKCTQNTEHTTPIATETPKSNGSCLNENNNQGITFRNKEHSFSSSKEFSSTMSSSKESTSETNRKSFFGISPKSPEKVQQSKRSSLDSIRNLFFGIKSSPEETSTTDGTMPKGPIEHKIPISIPDHSKKSSNIIDQLMRPMEPQVPNHMPEPSQPPIPEPPSPIERRIPIIVPESREHIVPIETTELNRNSFNEYRIPIDIPESSHLSQTILDELGIPKEHQIPIEKEDKKRYSEGSSTWSSQISPETGQTHKEHRVHFKQETSEYQSSKDLSNETYSNQHITHQEIPKEYRIPIAKEPTSKELAPTVPVAPIRTSKLPSSNTESPIVPPRSPTIPKEHRVPIFVEDNTKKEKTLMETFNEKMNELKELARELPVQMNRSCSVDPYHAPTEHREVFKRHQSVDRNEHLDMLNQEFKGFLQTNPRKFLSCQNLDDWSNFAEEAKNINGSSENIARPIRKEVLLCESRKAGRIRAPRLSTSTFDVSSSLPNYSPFPVTMRNGPSAPLPTYITRPHSTTLQGLQPKFHPPIAEDPAFSEQMADEWLNQIAEREERRLQKIIKVSKLRNDPGHRRTAFEASTDIGEEFLKKAKERRRRFCIQSDSDMESGTDVRGSETDEPSVKITDEKLKTKSRHLPQHFRDFVQITKEFKQEEKVEKSSATQDDFEKSSRTDFHRVSKKHQQQGSAFVKPNEVIYSLKHEYMSEPETENDKPKKMAQLDQTKYDGIGPSTNNGSAINLRSEVNQPNQHEWYKRIFQTLHKVKNDDDCVTIRYKCPRGRYPYKSSGYQSEPDGYHYDSDYYNMNNKPLDRRRPVWTPTQETSQRPYKTNIVKCGSPPYRAQPGKIEDYTPGNSSLVAEKVKQESIKRERLSNLYREGNLARSLLEPGYESDSNLVFRKKEESDYSTIDQRHSYKQVQAGGEPPLLGFRKPAPEKPKVSPSRYFETDVNIHYKTPVRYECKEIIPEEELAQRQAERMRKIYEEEKYQKYIKQLQDINSRRHTDNFTPSQKSPIPLNRYDDFNSELICIKSPNLIPPNTISRALYDFQGQTIRELSFKKGDYVILRRQVDNNWYEGEHNARVGLLPIKYVEILTKDLGARRPKTPSEGQARAKYNFQAQSAIELSLNKGELVTLIRKVDQNWFEGKIANRKGIFPCSYVEILTDIGAEDKMNKSIAEYSQQTSAVARSNLNNNFPNTIPIDTIRETKTISNTKVLHVDTDVEPLLYRALYKYRPQNSDELELKEGDFIYVLEVCDDGWFVGTSQRTGCFGTFPGNYVQRVAN